METVSKIYCSTAGTHYGVITQVLKEDLGWVPSRKMPEDDCDLIWTDKSIPPERLSRMKLFQRINHFPGMHVISRKNSLALYTLRMQKTLPTEYNFLPRTWVLPADAADLKLQFKSNKVFIVKPAALSQGRGIFLARSLPELTLKKSLVVQEYIVNPLLIHGLKFDLRIYVLVLSFDPLKVFIHRDGLTRFATEPYTVSDIDNLCIHLTNYAINKNSSNFVFNHYPDDNLGHKRDLESTLGFLDGMGHDVRTLTQEIDAIIIKTLCVASGSVAHLYKSCKPDDISKSMCFQLLGFDIIIDVNLKPWLLEVNHSPSFSTDTHLDWRVKRNVILDSLMLLNIQPNHRAQCLSELNQKAKERLGQQAKHSIGLKQKNIELLQAKRIEWEDANLRGFRRIFPNDKYNQILLTSKLVWEEIAGRRRVRHHPEPAESPHGTGTSISFSVGKLNLKQPVDLTLSVELPPVQNEKLPRMSVSYVRIRRPQKKLGREYGISSPPGGEIQDAELSTVSRARPENSQGRFLAPSKFNFSPKLRNKRLIRPASRMTRTRKIPRRKPAGFPSIS